MRGQNGRYVYERIRPIRADCRGRGRILSLPHTLRLVVLGVILTGASVVVASAPRDAAASPASNSAGAVVLVNSQSPGYPAYTERVALYLQHFGVPGDVLDISAEPVTADIGGYALIVIGHDALDTTGTYLSTDEQQIIADAVAAGTGLVNFDSDIAFADTDRYSFVADIFGFPYAGAFTGGLLRLPDNSHYITALQPGLQEWGPRDTLHGPLVPVLPPGVTRHLEIDAFGPQTVPLMVSASFGQGRAVQWLSDDWMDPAVFGMFEGWDDLVWRGMAWSARKPFVLRGTPPLVTMRVDDAVGHNDFAWLDAANDYGFKPLISYMLLDISPQEAAVLRDAVDNGNATVTVHSRVSDDTNFFYWNHAMAAPYSDTAIAAHFSLLDSFVATYGIEQSKIALAHFYEFGSNVFGELDARGYEYVASVNGIDAQYTPAAPPVLAAPFRTFAAPGDNTQNRNVYFADDLFIGDGNPLNDAFFRFIVEVREDSYDWTPLHLDGQAAGIESGKRKLRRALSSMVPAAIFTNEPHLQLSDADLRTQLAAITASIANYEPIYTTMDYQAQYARALSTSNLDAAGYDAGSSDLTLVYSGDTDLDTQFYLFTGPPEAIEQDLLNIPPFQSGHTITFDVSSEVIAPQSMIASPASGTQVADAVVTVTGTASDNGGLGLQEIEVSTDGGTTWSPATGTSSWSYTWNVAETGVHVIRSRARDTTGVTEVPKQGVTVNVVDPDGDGIGEGDNCPFVFNPGQENNDRNFIQTNPPKAYNDFTRPISDELGDACDDDDDNDGLTDAQEADLMAWCPSASGNTDPFLADTDGDRRIDGAECLLGTDPLNPASFPPTIVGVDADRDLLPDSLDPDPANPDTDGDGILDGYEFRYYGTDPALVDSDGDGCADNKEIASVNQDFVVNAIDLSQVALAFGPSTGPNYHPNLDMTKDGTVNSLDLVIVAKSFGPC